LQDIVVVYLNDNFVSSINSAAKISRQRLPPCAGLAMPSNWQA